MKRTLCLLLALLLGATGVAGATGAATAEAPMLLRFEVYRYGELAYRPGAVKAVDGGYAASPDGGETWLPVDDAVAEALVDVYERYGLAAWNGFSEENPYVLDGEGFWLEIELDDGATVTAHGSNAFPPDYFPAMREIQDILDGIEYAPAAPEAWIVGADIAPEAITEFYYTYDASTDPPFYQRYRFYRDGGAVMLYHETREGGGWPQTEADITASGTVALTEEAVARLDALLAGGTVRRREESLGDGDPGPWLYLCWDGDEDDIQQFAFESWEKEKEFEAFCEELRG